MVRRIATILLTAYLGVIASAQPGPRVELVAKLLEFSENAVIYHFEGGPPVTYHSSSFRVLAPEEYCGKTLLVYHAQVPAADSLWRRLGRVYRLSVSAERARDLVEPGSRDFLGTEWVEVIDEVAVEEIPGGGCAEKEGRAEARNVVPRA